eukprot:jgi/Bigna1/34165/e_gw1.4.49.1
MGGTPSRSASRLFAASSIVVLIFIAANHSHDYLRAAQFQSTGRRSGRGWARKAQGGAAKKILRGLSANELAKTASKTLRLCKLSSQIEERGVSFDPGPAFYRAESVISRDLAVLAAKVYRNYTGRLHVLDLMSGCGVRAKRYLVQADADSVWANDWNPANGGNRRSITSGPLSKVEGAEFKSNATLSQFEASRLLSSCYLREHFFDLIDVDSFGSDAPVAQALQVLKFGGLLYLTCTDGLSSAGHRPDRTLAAFGAYMSPSLPFANEQGLRMLIGHAVREGAAQGKVVTPLFSLYASHGPVFRAMLRVSRGRQWKRQKYGFLGYSHKTAACRAITWDSLMQGRVEGGCGGEEGENGVKILSGPMWIGPLHDEEFLLHMRTAATAEGWEGPGRQPVRLEELMDILLEEAQPELNPWFITTNEIARAGSLPRVPGTAELIQLLRDAGYKSARCHVDTRGVRTSASMDQVIDILRRQ